MRILLKNGLVPYGSGYNSKKIDILIEGSKIVKITKDIPKNSAEKIIDAKNKLVIPGLINTHTHIPMSLFRGLADDLKLDEWLQKYIWPREAKLTKKDVYYGSLLALLEMIKSGTTTFVDMYFHEDEVAKAALKSGLRGYLAYGMIDFGNKEKAEKEIKEAKRIMKYIDSLKSERINFLFGPHAPYTCSPEFLSEIKHLADKYQKFITIHVAETKDEVKMIKKKYGKTPTHLLDSIGFLSEKVLVAHAVWLIKKDIEILAKRNVTVSHNPVSNMKLASGVMKLKELLAANVNITLGTDGPASNNTLDMFEEMKLAALLHKIATLDPSTVDAKTVFKMATENAAKFLGIRAGKIKEGYLADLVLINLNKPHLKPLTNPISHLVYSANGSDVDTVIVNGKVVMENREVLTINEEKILSKIDKIAKKFL
ncbi:MAG: amidohydrolase family protein [Candidatus Aenigmarchaeota archaeon]|nr:amidohydrolase family protein [Candidatus Aenigmarchaeota archaeon]